MKSESVLRFFLNLIITNDLKNDVMQYKILNMANNFSDHRPISIVIRNCINEFCKPNNSQAHVAKRFSYRWDKCHLSDYYDASRVTCSGIVLDSGYATCNNNSVAPMPATTWP